MAKRLTDSDKWEDPWFLDLSTEHKMIWIYLLDKCNHAGIWKVNKRLMDFCLGYSSDFQAFLKAAGDKIRVLNDEKWFIPNFLTFQYGVLDERNLMSKRVFPLLEKEGLRKGVISPFNGVKVKNKDKNKDRNKEKETEFLEIWSQYPNKAGKTRAFERFVSSVKSEDDLQAIREALKRYLKHLQENTWKQAQDGKTWFNNWRDWINYVEPERRETDAERDARLLKQICS